ncbi:MAG: hypothetical protein Q9191_008292, partial [Dirinaria sp. TL-2023a]
MSTESSLPSVISSPIVLDEKSIYASVQDGYSWAAKGNDGNYGHTVASAFGYSKEELTHVPIESNLGLSCGNPFAVANIREGETVIDLGSGAGFDVFQAATKVGPSGKVIGTDMNRDMVARAEKIKEKIKASNTSFIQSRITKINLPDATADCIISNCVINLIPTGDKQSSFHEMFRLLKPHGRVAISDILLKQDLPNELKSNMALYVGCIAGASRVEEYENYLKEAGFKDILIIADQSDLNVYKTANKDDTKNSTRPGCCGGGNEDKSPCCGSVDAVVKDDGKWRDVDFNEWA